MPSMWVPLESSPEVYNAWAKPIGLPDGPLSFQEVFSLDEDFLSFVPKPVKAVLLLFPTHGALQQAREAEEKDPELKFKGSDVWWIKQTIGNACGSIGLLHALLNLPEKGPYALSPDSDLLQFKAETLPLAPLDRAKHLENAEFFSKAHSSALESGQTEVPEDLDNVEYHFIAFVEAVNEAGEKRVVELDGARSGPLDRGACTDLLRDTAKVVQEKYMARAEGDVNFNLIVLAGQEE